MERAPLTPAECTLVGYPAMMIDIVQLRQSDFDARANDAEWRAGLNLWFAAWQSQPAGSLLADERALSKAAGLGADLKSWRKLAGVAMQGFVLCSDGRHYHRTVCINALGIWIDKLLRRLAGAKGNRGDRSEAEKQADLADINAQIVRAEACLRSLDPTHPALAKAARRQQSTSHSAPHCGPASEGNAGALRPQYNRIELKEEGKNPSQEQAVVLQLGAPREAAA